MKIFWGISVYDRMDHLHRLEDTLREWYGQDITIAVFCNKTDRHDAARHREDIFIAETKNSGHHGGVVDAINSLHDTFVQSGLGDVFFHSHADVLPGSKKIVDRMVEEIGATGNVFLEKSESVNIHRN